MEKDLLNIERVKGVLYTMPMVKKRILQKKLRKWQYIWQRIVLVEVFHILYIRLKSLRELRNIFSD